MGHNSYARGQGHDFLSRPEYLRNLATFQLTSVAQQTGIDTPVRTGSSGIAGGEFARPPCAKYPSTDIVTTRLLDEVSPWHNFTFSGCAIIDARVAPGLKVFRSLPGALFFVWRFHDSRSQASSSQITGYTRHFSVLTKRILQHGPSVSTFTYPHARSSHLFIHFIPRSFTHAIGANAPAASLFRAHLYKILLLFSKSSSPFLTVSD